jgi:hypothetical protein
MASGRPGTRTSSSKSSSRAAGRFGDCRLLPRSSVTAPLSSARPTPRRCDHRIRFRHTGRQQDLGTAASRDGACTADVGRVCASRWRSSTPPLCARHGRSSPSIVPAWPRSMTTRTPHACPPMVNQPPQCRAPRIAARAAAKAAIRADWSGGANYHGDDAGTAGADAGRHRPAAVRRLRLLL